LSSSDAAQLRPADIEALGTRCAGILEGDPHNASEREPRVWIICAKFNGHVSARLCNGALDAFGTHGVSPDSIRIAWVPGAFELPLVAQQSIADGEADAVVCLGAVIRGDTPHFDFVAGEAASGIARVALDSGIPVVFGVLTTNTVDQAMERSEPGETNKGYESALTALEMLDLLPRIAGGAAASSSSTAPSGSASTASAVGDRQQR
jgi:6,7-dimethyl-8-ribityllumazine synthase